MSKAHKTMLTEPVWNLRANGSLQLGPPTANLFVMCIAYYSTYMPVIVRMVLTAKGTTVPDAVNFFVTWIYISSAAVNGFLYMALHSSVRRELRRYLPRCRRFAVAPASSTQPVGNAGARWQHGCVDTEAATPGAPVSLMTSSLNK